MAQKLSQKFISFFKDKNPMTRMKSASTVGVRKVRDDMTKSKVKKKLPDNFTETIIQLESELEEENVNILSVFKLLELYTLGVEYFESIRSNKYKVYQTKMNNLLQKPNIVKSMEQNSPMRKAKNQLISNLKKNIKEENADSIMKSSQRNINEIDLIVDGNVKNQTSTIIDRLNKRKEKANMTRSMTTSSISEFNSLGKTTETSVNELKSSKKIFKTTFRY